MALLRALSHCKVAGLSEWMNSQNIGALAQLGERLHGMQEVSGSIPLGSTIFADKKTSGGRFPAKMPSVSAGGGIERTLWFRLLSNFQVTCGNFWIASSLRFSQ